MSFSFHVGVQHSMPRVRALAVAWRYTAGEQLDERKQPMDTPFESRSALERAAHPVTHPGLLQHNA